MNNQMPESTVGGESSDSQATTTTPIFNTRELATVLASLRYWQREGLLSEGHELDIATRDGELSSLSMGEIDTLCERLNFLELRADLVVGHPVSDEYTADHVSAVAEKFLQHLERDLGSPQVYALVCLQNLVESNPLVCHSHDHLDANMTMAGAVAEVLGIEPDDVDVQNVHVTALWNKAWNAAFHDMREVARAKMPETLDRLGVMRSVFTKAPSLGLSGREAVLAAGQEIYGEGFANSEAAITFVAGLNALALDALEARHVLEAVEGVLASRADRGDKVAHSLWTVVVDALTAGSSRSKFPMAVIKVDAYLEEESKNGDELIANLHKLLRDTIANQASHVQSGMSAMARGHSAYEATEEDVANVLSSNAMAVANTNGKSFESMAAEIFPDLDFARIEEAALHGDELDEQTDYANDEIARQLRVMGVLEPLKAVEVGQESAGASGGLKTAIEALRLAAECGGDLDKPFYQDALTGLIRVNSQVLAYDASLNAREEAPTGSDFNEVFGMLGLDPKSVVDPTAEKWGAMRSSLREGLQSATKVQGKTGVAEQLAILQAAMEHISQGGVQYSTDARELTVMAKEALKDAGLAPVRTVSKSRDDGPSP